MTHRLTSQRECAICVSSMQIFWDFEYVQTLTRQIKRLIKYQMNCSSAPLMELNCEQFRLFRPRDNLSCAIGFVKSLNLEFSQLNNSMILSLWKCYLFCSHASDRTCWKDVKLAKLRNHALLRFQISVAHFTCCSVQRAGLFTVRRASEIVPSIKDVSS